MTSIVIALVAMAQLEDIYDYSLRRWGRAQADVYSDSLLDAIEKIAAREVPWRAVGADMGVDGYFYRRGAHFIYWRAGEGTIRVVAILHQRMHQMDRLQQSLVNEP